MSQKNPLQFAPTRLLVPLDFSPASGEALAAAQNLAIHFEAEVHLVHVISMLSTTETAMDFFPENAVIEEARLAAERRLAGMVRNLQERGVYADYEIPIGNDIVGKILLSLKAQEAEMLVLSTHGMSGWHPFVFGSVAQQVIKQARCPLLLIHPAKKLPGIESAIIAHHESMEETPVSPMHLKIA